MDVAHQRAVDVQVPATSHIVLEDITKVFNTGRLEFHALKGVDLAVGRGDFVAVVGPSGSGKSTLLNVITGIDRPTSGTVTVGGERVDTMSEEELAVWRGETVGIVFQFFQLLPTLTALENAVLPLDFARGDQGDRIERGMQNLARVGLGDKADHLPFELSGGEQQRVAIARSLARNPQLIIADEPTGNLDSATAEEVLGILTDLHEDGTTVMFVTHDSDLAARANRTVRVRDGRIVE